MSDTVRVAALQIEAEVGNEDANLAMCEVLADRAAREGARWIVLPEFFASGVANRPELAESAPPPDGAPTQLLRDLAARHEAHVAGSCLVRDADGHVRNAFFLAGPDGELLGRHDKDLPTMWESSLYIGGGDPGRIATDGPDVGIAMCWELLRSGTVERLAGRVDLVLAGSGWWSIPAWPPKALMRRLEAANEERAVAAPANFARAVGAPVVHAAHSGEVTCPWPLAGVMYRGHFEGGATVADADGRVVAQRRRHEGPGVVVADVTPRRVPPPPLPDRFWFQRRGALEAAVWAYQNPWGRRAYRRSRAQAPLPHATPRTEIPA